MLKVEFIAYLCFDPTLLHPIVAFSLHPTGEGRYSIPSFPGPDSSKKHPRASIPLRLLRHVHQKHCLFQQRQGAHASAQSGGCPARGGLHGCHAIGVIGAGVEIPCAWRGKTRICWTLSLMPTDWLCLMSLPLELRSKKVCKPAKRGSVSTETGDW